MLNKFLNSILGKQAPDMNMAQNNPWALSLTPGPTMCKGMPDFVMHCRSHQEAMDEQDSMCKAGWVSLGIQWCNTMEAAAQL